jgi:hypothetical protein
MILEEPLSLCGLLPYEKIIGTHTTSIVGGWLARINIKGISYEDKQVRDKNFYVDEIL